MVKILIVRVAALGDILQALPVVAGIRDALPGATIGWMISAKWSEVLAAPGAEDDSELSERKPIVNHVHIVRKRWATHRFQPTVLAGAWGEIKRMRGIGYDLALDFGSTLKENFVTLLTGVRPRFGFTELSQDTRRFFFTERLPRIGTHVVSWNQEFAARALEKYLPEDSFKACRPALPRDAAAGAWAEREAARLGIKRFVLMSPGAGWGAKRWPADRYGLVARGLAHRNVASLVNIGPGEDALADAAVNSSGGTALPVACSVGQLIALTRRAEMVIAGDTGPLHLAAALGIPVVALYGDSPPEISGPYGTRSIVLRHPESRWTNINEDAPDPGLLKISPEEVIAAAERLMDGAHHF